MIVTPLSNSCSSSRPSRKLAPRAIAAPDIAFQSSNRWDIGGAKAFGMTCHWINRSGAPEEYAQFAPDKVLSSLAGLMEPATVA